MARVGAFHERNLTEIQQTLTKYTDNNTITTRFFATDSNEKCRVIYKQKYAATVTVNAGTVL